MSDYCEGPEFYNEERVKARKQHRCDECQRAIPIGAVYVRCSGKWDGYVATYRQHVECRDFCASVNLEHIGECLIPFGGMNDAINDLGDYGLYDVALVLDLQQEWERIKVLYPEVSS